MEPSDHERPDGVSDATVEAVGKLSEAYEFVVRARGHLYSFHQLMGRADLLFGEAADLLDEAGHGDASHRVEDELVGRNVLDGRWTFQIVEEFDRLYYAAATEAEAVVRAELMGGRRHVYESEMKDRRRSPQRVGHERRPAAAHSPEIDTDADPPRRQSA